MRRRTVISLTLAGAVAATRLTAIAHAVDQPEFPSEYIIPGDQTYPEGIAHDPRSPYFFTGSATDGTIYRGHVSEPRAKAFIPGGRDGLTSALGMKIDDAGRLIVAGAETGKVFVFDSVTGRLLNRFTAEAEGGLLNDLAVASNGDVYITDSFRPYLYRITRNELEHAPGDAPLKPWLNLEKTPIKYTEGFNLNGIVVTPDQRHLIVSKTNNSTLYRIDLRRKTAKALDLGDAKVNGDGLLVRDDILYAVENDPQDAIAVLRLTHGKPRATLVRRVTDPRLRVPSTAAFDGRGTLLVVNFQITDPTPQLPFTVVRVRVSR